MQPVNTTLGARIPRYFYFDLDSVKAIIISRNVNPTMISTLKILLISFLSGHRRIATTQLIVSLWL